MKIVTRQKSGEVRTGGSLIVTILEICGISIKLGFKSQPSGAPEYNPIQSLSQIRSNRRGYYRFSENGDRLLVLELTKGRRVGLNGSEELVVVEVRRAGVTLAICSGRECERYIDGNGGAEAFPVYVPA